MELPNTRAMSQFADGGMVATKPYAASANYIRKMSDYCAACGYDARKKHGAGACPFNSLYWDFYARHRQRLESKTMPKMSFQPLWPRDQLVSKGQSRETAEFESRFERARIAANSFQRPDYINKTQLPGLCCRIDSNCQSSTYPIEFRF